MPTGGDTFPADGRKGRHSPFLSLARRATIILDWSGRVIVFVCLVSMFLFLLANVVLRYVSGSGIAWAYEIHALLLPWLVAGGLVMASARGRNIAISLLADMLNGRALLALNLVIQGVILVIAVSVLWSSQPILKASQFQSFSTLGLKQIWGYSSLVYAFAAMALIAALEIARTLAGEDVVDRDPSHSSLS
jgi:TRAP-type C4-dicarboxylate transport system permease small subunit